MRDRREPRDLSFPAKAKSGGIIWSKKLTRFRYHLRKRVDSKLETRNSKRIFYCGVLNLCRGLGRVALGSLGVLLIAVSSDFRYFGALT